MPDEFEDITPARLRALEDTDYQGDNNDNPAEDQHPDTSLVDSDSEDRHDNHNRDPDD